MKKMLCVIAGAVMVCCGATAGNLAWGSALPDGSDIASFTGWDGGVFTGTAFLYILTDVSSPITWDAGTGTWDLNGARLISTSVVGASSEWGEAGTFGYGAAVFPDSDVGQHTIYQMVLTSMVGAAGIDDTTSTVMPVPPDYYWATAWLGESTEWMTVGGTDNWAQLFTDTIIGEWEGVQAAPEPTSAALLALGAAALGLRRRFRK